MNYPAGICIACFLSLASVAEAQTASDKAPASPSALVKRVNPIPAAHKPFFVPTRLDLKVSVGYVFTNAGMPSLSRLNLDGLEMAAIADLSPYFGMIADSSYVRAKNVFGTSRSGDILSYLAGPVVYPLARGKTRLYVHSLVGGARVTAALPADGGGIVTGFVNKFSWAVGGGIEYQVSQFIVLRSGGDYQHTYFFGPSDVIQGQHDFRAVCSVAFSVWRLKDRY